jgi:hypothetical protein
MSLSFTFKHYYEPSIINNNIEKIIDLDKFKLQFIIKIKKIYFGDININKFYIKYLENYLKKITLADQDDYAFKSKTGEILIPKIKDSCEYNYQNLYDKLGIDHYYIDSRKISITLNILDNKLIEIIKLIIKYINNLSDIDLENIYLELEKYNIKDIFIFPSCLRYFNKYRYEHALYFLNEFINLHI